MGTYHLAPKATQLAYHGAICREWVVLHEVLAGEAPFAQIHAALVLQRLRVCIPAIDLEEHTGNGPMGDIETTGPVSMAFFAVCETLDHNGPQPSFWHHERQGFKRLRLERTVGRGMLYRTETEVNHLDWDSDPND